MSNNLDLTQVAEDQDNADAAINDKGGELDAALTETFDVDISAGNATVTSANYRRAIRLNVTGGAAARDVTLPAVKRAVMIVSDADNTDDVTLKVGTTSIAITPGSTSWFYTDGTTNGLEQIGGGSSGAKPFDVIFFIPGLPAANAKVCVVNVVRAFTWPAGLTGTIFKCGVNPTATADFDVSQNGSSIGTLSLSTSGLATLTFASAVTFAVNDQIVITSPTVQDTTLADVSCTIVGSI